uniref:SusC/RagA family TonB-linked outer membrane protein n=1 Tax=Persicitalea sp. TaxID=3100273 RepID=UPI0035930B63
MKHFALACALLAGSLPSPGMAQTLLASQRNAQTSTDKSPQRAAVPLRQALKTLEDRFSVRFGYDSRLLDSQPTVKMPTADNLPAALSALLTPLGVQYEKISPTVYVLSALPAASAKASAVVERRISGTVTASDNSLPLPGVSVTLKGSGRGTTTDAEGRYALTVPDAGGVLVFSFVGYVSQERETGNQSTLDVTLAPDLKALDEVVVVGYGTAQQGDLTSSIASLKAKDLQNQPVTSPDALLQGKAAGVQVVQNSGTPAGEIFIRIRGTASLLGETRPLYVVDGVPLNNFGGTVLDAGGQRQSALADINPNDIESIDILKDAAAAAIYGARGSNGVVLITTKRGKAGKARFNFDSYTGVQRVNKRLDLLNGDQFVELLRESLVNRGRNPLTETPFNQVTPTGINTDWQDQIFRTAPISNYNLSVAGGNERVSTFASLGYFNQKGTVIGQAYQRYNLRVNLDYKATDKLKIGTSTLLSNALQNRVANDFSGFSILANALIRSPNLPVRNDDGTYPLDPLLNENPVMLAEEIQAKSNQKRVVTNLYAEYAILKNLSFRTTFGIDYLADRQQRYVPSYVIARNGRAEALAISSDQFTWVTDNTLTYQQQFGSHKVSVLAGTGFQRSASNFLQAGGQTAGSD